MNDLRSRKPLVYDERKEKENKIIMEGRLYGRDARAVLPGWRTRSLLVGLSFSSWKPTNDAMHDVKKSHRHRRQLEGVEERKRAALLRCLFRLFRSDCGRQQYTSCRRKERWSRQEEGNWIVQKKNRQLFWVTHKIRNEASKNNRKGLSIQLCRTVGAYARERRRKKEK